nr:baseplate J/gp47 family protein [uncultured Aminipila sp.]
MSVTKEELKTRMLAEISNDYDKSEGSFFFDAISPVAIELEKSYTGQESILSNAFVATASGSYLDSKCAELGVVRKLATKATGTVKISGAKGAVMTKGSLVATELVTFQTKESVTIGEGGSALVGVECTASGTVGNVASNAIKYFPITIEGILSVMNSEPFTSGYDTETDESLRQRYYDKINTPATSGNAAHYEQWAKAVTGVGSGKVFPTWNGPGTVKVVICNRNKRAADAKLIKDTAEYIETQRPIGATVTVESVQEKAIDVTATVVLANGVILEQVKNDFVNVLKEYFKEIALVDQYVSYAKVGSLLYSIYGVADYSNLQLNKGIANIALSEVEVPVVGMVVLS